MKKLSLFLFLFFWGFAQGQTFTSNQNYVYTRVFLDSVTAGSNFNSAQSIQSVQYSDGLGRPKQSISINAIKPNQDIVTSYFYEEGGKQTKQYLPISASSQNGGLHSIVEPAINSYHGTANAYSEVQFDGSPLKRVVKKASPGNDWGMNSGNLQEFFYEFNAGNEVKKYASTLNTTSFQNSLEDHGYYDPNVLFKNSFKDEDGNLSIVYKNGLGQVIMTRVKNGVENLDTYYVYNQFGQQVFVIPPLNDGENILDSTIQDKICYQYRYDALGRMIEKKIPGRSKEYFVYDKENRVIMSTDEKLKSGGKWTYVKYDRFGRVIYTGICTGGERESEQNNAEGSTQLYETRTENSPGFSVIGFGVYYTKNAYPTAVTEVLSINYYDEYPAGFAVPKPENIYSQPTLSSDNLENHSTKSLLTASYVRNIENTGWNKTLFWYDAKERLIGNHKVNYLSGTTRTEMKLDFPGNITESKVLHSRAGSSPDVVVKQRYVYSQQNLLVRHYHQVDSQPEELLQELTYDDLGRIANKKVGNNLQSIDYQYNIRGWLTSINNPDNLGTDLFGFRIGFNQREGELTPNNERPDLQVKPKYNGGIAETYWATEDRKGRYGYVYDPAGRMIAGLFQNPDDPYIKENSEITTYDRRGNIGTLKRSGYKFKGPVQLIDNLTYTYDGNRLHNITDSTNNPSGYQGGGAAVQYDTNGNMTAMPDKGITYISYNFLNLVNGISNAYNTSFLYSADGAKLKKTLVLQYNGSNVRIITEYLDGFQYSTPNTGLVNGAREADDRATELARTATQPEAFAMEDVPVAAAPPGGADTVELAFFATSEGYYDYRKKQYIYQYKDHLGNVRLSYTQNSAGVLEIIDRNTYYPFGMNHLSPSGGQSLYDPLAGTYKYKYNGKELQETGMYDYGWRQYMPDIGRWNGIDQLAEKFVGTSTYAYVMNNPISFFDPDGRDKKPSSGNWLQDIWNATDSYSSWTNNGNGSFVGGEIGMSHQDFTNFYNFLAAGGTGNYTYWTNGAMPAGGYSVGSDGVKIRDMQEVIGHNITVSSWIGIPKAPDESHDNKWLGLFVSGTSFGTGVYSDYVHNHKTYTTTKGVTKNIYKANGAVRSARAAEFASKSKFIKGLGIAGAVASTGYSALNVANQWNEGGVSNINRLDAADTLVGTVGLGSTLLVAAGLVSNPVGWAIGAGVTIYFGARLAYDLYNTVSD
ncbi:DUF6443 domain-containing protein [Chryseobacterium koreense]|uniref:DUF6443 domain-containing protein n=1 Tax=Chryseobacterium koreense TaxID=232216 RepID=UPI0026EB6A00|nr:DUF6443 domain-containing protein [Chryseobacterium koreense]